MYNEVLYAEPAYIIFASETIPNDPYFDQTWGMQDIEAPLAWDIEKGSDEVIVGVIDTGIDYNHEDLVENMWTNDGEIPDNGIDDDENGYVDDYYGYDFYHDDGDPFDEGGQCGHSTHVSGTIAAKGNNGIGVAGVSWHTKIASLKFLEYNGYSCGGDGADAVEAVLYAAMMGMDITNNSWGGGGYLQSLKDAIEYSNILFVGSETGEAPNNAITAYILKEGIGKNICNLTIGSEQWQTLYNRNQEKMEETFDNYFFRVHYSKDFSSVEQLVKNALVDKKFSEDYFGFPLNSEKTHIFLAGDPAFIGAPKKKGRWEFEQSGGGLIPILQSEGFIISTRFKTGNIEYECYW